jgi:hypothetical protein
MSNHFDQQSPRTDWRAVPPIDPDRLQLYLLRARQLRAEAFAEGVKLTARALGAVVRRVRYTFRDGLAAARGHMRHHHAGPLQPRS